MEDWAGAVENQLLTDSEKEMFREFEETFNTAGWKRIVEDMRKELDTLPAQVFWNAKNWEEIVAVRERLANLAHLTQYETLIQNQMSGIVQNRLSELAEQQDETYANE